MINRFFNWIASLFIRTDQQQAPEPSPIKSPPPERPVDTSGTGGKALHLFTFIYHTTSSLGKERGRMKRQMPEMDLPAFMTTKEFQEKEMPIFSPLVMARTKKAAIWQQQTQLDMFNDLVDIMEYHGELIGMTPRNVRRAVSRKLVKMRGHAWYIKEHADRIRLAAARKKPATKESTESIPATA